VRGLHLDRRRAPAVEESDLELVHDRALIGAIEQLCLAGGGQIDADTAVGEVSYLAARHAAGGACALVEALLGGEARAGFSALRPAGHHADRGRSMGFCLFNNVAIAAEHAIRRLGAERVMIIDWDVHHGNGTAEIFRARRDVLFASIHQQGLYPGTGSISDLGSGPGLGYTINVPVPRGSGEEIWVSVLEHVIIPAGLEFRPNLVLISAGFDAHRDDPLADCVLETESFAQLASHVREFAAECDAPVGAVLEGGYELGPHRALLDAVSQGRRRRRIRMPRTPRRHRAPRARHTGGPSTGRRRSDARGCARPSPARPGRPDRRT
jgi:acetoin utilization deacetylase AcuC-like enzyme